MLFKPVSLQPIISTTTRSVTRMCDKEGSSFGTKLHVTVTKSDPSIADQDKNLYEHVIFEL